MVYARLPIIGWVGCLALMGCSHIGGEAYQRSAERDWKRFIHTNYIQTFRELTGVNNLLPDQHDAERMAEREVCNHPHSQNRVVSQNGIEDYTVYRRCAASPYPSETGVRLFGRPES